MTGGCDPEGLPHTLTSSVDPASNFDLHCQVSGGSGWTYAPFLLNRYTRWDPQERIATIYYLMSTSAPYQVMLMRSQLAFSSVE